MDLRKQWRRQEFVMGVSEKFGKLLPLFHLTFGKKISFFAKISRDLLLVMSKISDDLRFLALSNISEFLMTCFLHHVPKKIQKFQISHDDFFSHVQNPKLQFSHTLFSSTLNLLHQCIRILTHPIIHFLHLLHCIQFFSIYLKNVSPNSQWGGCFKPQTPCLRLCSKGTQTVRWLWWMRFGIETVREMGSRG